MPAIVNYVICLPLKIDYICNVHKTKEYVCDPSGVIDAGFGYAYESLLKNSEKFMASYRNISFSLKIIDPNKMKGVKMLKHAGKGISAAVNEKIRLMDHIMMFCKKLFVLIFLKIIYGNLRLRRACTICFNFIFIRCHFIS